MPQKTIYRILFSVVIFLCLTVHSQAISLLSSGAVNSKSDTLTLSTQSISQTPGDYKIILLAVSKQPDQSFIFVRFFSIHSLGWNDFSLVHAVGDLTIWQLILGDSRAISDSQITIKFDGSGSSAATHVVVGGFSSGPELDAISSAQYSNSSSPTSGSISRSTASEFLWGILSTHGPSSDNPGNWSTPFSSNNRYGTSGGSPSKQRTIADGYAIVSTLDDNSVTVNNITSRECEIVLVAYK